MTKEVHGGNIYKYERKMIDFSANLNPLGMPEKAKEAIISNIDKYENYPDPFNRELREKVSKFQKVKEEQLSFGNGAADIIFKIALAFKPKRALIVEPTFSEYEEALSLAGTDIDYFILKEEDGFVLDMDGLIKQIEEERENPYDIVFICNPNNPTGIPVEREKILKLAGATSKTGAKLVIDQCFSEFMEEEEKYSVLDDIAKADNLTNLDVLTNSDGAAPADQVDCAAPADLTGREDENDRTKLKGVIILKAFTKIFAMAGLRLGYCVCSEEETADQISSILQPWSVSTVASKAGVYALSEEGFIEKTKKYITTQRTYLIKELEKIGMKVFNTKTNYIFFKTEESIIKELEEKGFLVRSCSNYPTLDSRFYRIAVRTKDENIAFIKALQDILKKEEE